MIHFDMPPQKSNIIKVLGFGGGGGNAVNHMFAQQIHNVDFIVCNTDAQALANSAVPNKVQLGPHLTGGLGAGANPSVGKKATEESLEEIRRMLEVNTKMAFITAGMGGGTGTGGAPIVAKICRELGILTVGIVTTPFSFEGPKRMAQAQAGVKELKEHVDTLLVISNDKLRHQFGNLKMKEAFSKADDVLTIAARCITDVINTAGEINVDFNDVCTVMRDGGVAILGSAQQGGEDRALRAIEEAANSPLLNDNDIAGAKWILLNISSASGEHECTMDEVEIIQEYLRQQTGENTDVIFGLNYDDSLDDKIGITLIATGFRHKDPFAKPEPKREAEAPPIVMTLGVAGEELKMDTSTSDSVAPVKEVTVQPFMPLLAEMERDMTLSAPVFHPVDNITIEEEHEEEQTLEAPVVFELSVDTAPAPVDTQIVEHEVKAEVPPPPQPDPANSELFAFLHKPASVYQPNDEKQAQPEPEVQKQDEPSMQPTLSFEVNEEDAAIAGITLSFDEEGIAPVPKSMKPQANMPQHHGGDLSEEEMQKRRAQERMNRLRNISFNPLHLDNNSEFDETPAYLRRNLDLHNSIANVEDFYSRATVKSDENNQGSISTVNNFLHGEKPD
jgi:cell division protein FtsZ